MMTGPLCTHSMNDPRFPGGSRNLVGFLIAEGVPVSTAYLLRCPDVHAMAVALARSNYMARTEQRLLLDEFPPPPPRPDPFRRLPVVVWTAVAALTIAALFLICTPVWRTFT